MGIQNKPFVFYLIFLIFFSFSSCELPPLPEEGSNNSTNSTTTKPDLPSTQEIVQGINDISEDLAELARPNKVQAWVSKLIIKAQPGKDMPQVGQMEEGEIAEYLYQRTVRKESFNLRGQNFNEAWILIKTKEGLMGWVHEGGVRFVNPAFEQIVKDLLGPPPGANQRSMPQAPVPLASQRQIIPGKQVGAITLNTSEVELIKLYGAGRVKRGKVKLPDGGAEDCTILFYNTNEEIRITWKKEDRLQVKAVYFDQLDAGWFSPMGLASGLPLKEMIKVNQAPFVFSGFGWTYGGVVDNWKTGKLAPISKYFYVILEPTNTARKDILQKYAGQSKFTTNAPELDQLNIRVKRLVVYLD
ncbi:MAG: SH3 domain-containing protein [Bacteroidia bacterium]|nr:SH3 domain-containing protein [Bacteroidia bacterium]